MPAALAPLAPAIDWARSLLFGGARTVSAELVADIGGKELRLSSARAERELGWRPLELEVSLTDTLAWLREQYDS
jgi:nucleoside-diphosphate-sugar epimerase